MSTALDVRTLDLPIGLVHPGDNDRKEFDEDKLWQLARSIEAIGMVQPITVRPLPDGTYRLVAGERRYRAHLLLAASTIRANVDASLDDKAEADKMLAENTGRADLSLMEEARAYQARIDRGETVESIAVIAGVAEFRVRWRLSLLGLIPECQEAVESGTVPSGPALELAKLGANQQIVGMRMWLKNPDMGAFTFRTLCQKLAAVAAEPEELTLGGVDWDAEAAAAKPTKFGTNADLIARLAAALVECGYTGPLLHEASVASGATLTHVGSNTQTPGGTQ